MNTAVTEKSNVIYKKDSDGNWYAVPTNLVDIFTQAVEEIILAEFMSDEWYEANDRLHEDFGCYMRADKE